eukprot:574970-Heterocapsa_arctica.AAC.1
MAVGPALAASSLTVPPLVCGQVVGSIATHLAHGRAAVTSVPSASLCAQAGHLPLLAFVTLA